MHKNTITLLHDDPSLYQQRNLLDVGMLKQGIGAQLKPSHLQARLMASTVCIVSTGFCSKTALVPVVAAIMYCADR